MRFNRDFITEDDLGPLNDALNKGEDIQIKRTPEGVKIQSLAVTTIKPAAQNPIPNTRGQRMYHGGKCR